LPPPYSPGVSRSWASREANALFDQTLDVIEDAMKARKIFVVKGVIVDGGPDHYARLEAAKLFILLMCKAGRTSRTTRRV
jgi:hypothetical protein